MRAFEIVVLVCLVGCSSRASVDSEARGCSGALASLNGISIGTEDVETVRARALGAGVTLAPPEAARETIWQEAERQRLGLPGSNTEELRQSRALAIQRYRDDLRRGRVPIDLQHSLPEATTLTACGKQWLGRN